MATTVVRPADPEFMRALRAAAACGAFLVLFHVAVTLWVRHLGWGYFRDEFYYLICGRRLAWGYVDQGPIVALQARAAETLFGRSLVGIRMFSAIAGGVRVFLTGLLAWSLGGKRAAQVLAMIGVMAVPNYLGIDSFLSMNSCESMFWMTALFAVILIARGGSPKLWLLFGAAAGLGLLNKPSMTFFLIALLVALIITPQRRLLATPWMLAGVALMLVIVAPYIVWQIHNHWPTLEFLENGRNRHKNVALGPLAMLGAQIREMHPVNLLIWLPGLVWLLKRSAWRWLGITYLVFLAIMMAMHAKDYYITPIYPILFAAGGLAWESWARGTARLRDPNRIFGFPVLEAVVVLLSLMVLPMSNPILTPKAWIAYADTLHLRGKASKTETMENGALPQFYADRFGWQEEVDQITRVYQALTPEEQRHTVIVCDNYGEASAVNFLGRGLPTAISGHNNYWLWGPGQPDITTAILVEGSTVAHLQQFADSVQVAGQTGTEYSMPYEHKHIFLLRGVRQTPGSMWADKKDYI